MLVGIKDHNTILDNHHHACGIGYCNTENKITRYMKKRIVVLGAGESGVGAAILSLKKGFDVFVSDMGPIKPRYKDMLNQHDITWEEKQHTREYILNADEVVKSPGIPDKSPIIV